MMHDASFRRWVYTILILSALMRFGFLLFGDVLPVMWDAGRYAAAGIGLISYVDTSGMKHVKNNTEDRMRFKYYNDKYIQGEQINWLAYKPHTLTKARDESFFSGPLYPLFLGIIFYLAPLADFTFARIFGILLDLISNLLLILIAIRLVGRVAAIIAGFIFAMYFPFILASSMLLLETSTNFWILLTIFLLILGYEDNKIKYLILAGITAGLLILNKPTAMLLSIPFLVGFYFYIKIKLNLSLIINRLLFFIAPLIIIFACWLGISSIKYEQLTLRDPAYQEANMRQSSSIIFEGYDLDKVVKDFWTYSIKEQILDNPFGYIGLLVKKFERLWSRPYNDFKKDFIVSYNANEIYHRILVMLGLLGLLLLMSRNFSHAGWLFFIIGYYTSIHLVFHSISRYSFNALPMVIIAAGYFIYVIVDLYLKSENKLKRKLLFAALIILLGWLLDYHWLNFVFNINLTYGVVLLSIIVKCFLIITAVQIISNFLFAGNKYSKKVIMPVAVLLVLVIFNWSTTLSRNGWSEFVCQINDSEVKAGTRIYISNMKQLKEGELLAAVIDINSGKGRQNSFTIKIDDFEDEYIGGKFPLSKLFYPKPTYRYYAQFEPIGIEEFRQYAIIELDDSLFLKNIKQKGFVDISVAINEQFEEENNFINIYGNSHISDTINYLPSVKYTSIERYVHKNDPRIRYPVKYLSDSTISYYIKRNSNDITLSNDLSPLPGIQSGRYNMFLMHFMPDGSFLVY